MGRARLPALASVHGRHGPDRHRGGTRAEIAVPWLLVHGSEDDVVPIADSHDILAQASDNAELEVIDGADHVFGEHAQVMVEKVVGWLQGQS